MEEVMEITDIRIRRIEAEGKLKAYVTVTFDDCFVNIINGDIFISPDTVKSNSQILKAEYITELKRVIIHGIMHLCGYEDKTEEQKCYMRSLEEKYLSYLEKL
jgi:rRNA maturation RNase YbeY